ncbi:MAG: hypothetical protein HJJLKODD_02139 [Phycisphaerae bacterium]|nr:hypothetical protein [Phycisphaerae bacterium]
MANTLAEASLYVLVHPCPHCQQGLRVTQQQEHVLNHPQQILFHYRCRRCEQFSQQHFEIKQPVEQNTKLPVINASPQPSQIIDLAQWVALFQTLTTKASQSNNRQESRQLGYEAALCLDEALKFYEADNDLPPSTAFFNENSRELARQHPQRFTRQQLLHWRSKLPTLAKMSDHLQQPTPQRPWWKFW